MDFHQNAVYTKQSQPAGTYVLRPRVVIQTPNWSQKHARRQPIGEFKNGRGEFFDQETLNGRGIFVRFVISDITPDSCRFEQAFSEDGGKTWEVNWIATDTRVKDESSEAH